MAAVDAALGRLPPSDRKILLLVADSGLDDSALAELLGVGHDALRQRKSRARQRLNRLMRLMEKQ